MLLLFASFYKGTNGRCMQMFPPLTVMNQIINVLVIGKAYSFNPSLCDEGIGHCDLEKEMTVMAERREQRRTKRDFMKEEKETD